MWKKLISEQDGIKVYEIKTPSGTLTFTEYQAEIMTPHGVLRSAKHLSFAKAVKEVKMFDGNCHDCGKVTDRASSMCSVCEAIRFAGIKADAAVNMTKVQHAPGCFNLAKKLNEEADAAASLAVIAMLSDQREPAEASE